MGLTYDRAFIDVLLRGVMAMKESSYYQGILADGMAEGMARGERRAVVRQGTQRLGPPDPAVLARLDAVDDLAELDRLSLAVLTAGSWAELLGN